MVGVSGKRRPVRRLQSKYSRTGGRRLENPSPRREPVARRGQGQDQPMSRGEKRRLWQMAISAIILVLVVAVKLAFPNVADRYRQQVLHLLGEDTDFVEAFASVGRAVSPDGKLSDPSGTVPFEALLSEADHILVEADGSARRPLKAHRSTVSPDGKLSDAVGGVYTAVFGPEEVPEKPKSDPDQTASVPEGQVIYTPENTPDIACMTQQMLGFDYGSPVDGTLTSGFGYREHPILGEQKFHYGVDIGADSGTPVRAFAAGTVTVVAEASELGKYVIVSHPGGYTSLYGHCSKITASSGQQVEIGTPIAEVGDTGMTTGPHLHFELMQGSTYLDPVYYALG